MDTLNRTDIHGKPIIERRAWSFSAIDKFTNCPRQFYQYTVAKTVKEPENPKMQEGFRVHKAMADFISDKKRLPKEYKHLAEWVPKFLHGDKVLTEHRLACTYEFKPCEYFARKEKVWLRSQCDLLILNDQHAYNIDWKTGSEKDPKYERLPPNFQLKLSSFLIFLHFPKIQSVTNKYVYLFDNYATDFTILRAEMESVVRQMFDIYGGFQRAHRTQDYPPRPSGLCKKHCAVSSCEYHGKGAY